MGNTGSSRRTVPSMQPHGSALTCFLKPVDFVMYCSKERNKASKDVRETFEYFRKWVYFVEIPTNQLETRMSTSTSTRPESSG